MNKLAIIPAAVSLCICMGLLVTVGYRQKQALNSAGKCLIPINRGKPTQQILLAICCMILPCIILFRNFDLFINIVLCAVGVLGCELSCRSYISSKSGGLYEHGILAENGFIPFSEILSIPVVTWEDRNPKTDTRTELELVTEKSNSLKIPFASAEECRNITNKILELVPRLKG